jgi:hypothetical protein
MMKNQTGDERAHIVTGQPRLTKAGLKQLVELANSGKGELTFELEPVVLPQPTREELLLSAEQWAKTAQLALSSFSNLAESGDRPGCKQAIKAFLDSAQMVADRMLEACP